MQELVDTLHSHLSSVEGELLLSQADLQDKCNENTQLRRQLVDMAEERHSQFEKLHKAHQTKRELAQTLDHLELSFKKLHSYMECLEQEQEQKQTRPALGTMDQNANRTSQASQAARDRKKSPSAAWTSSASASSPSTTSIPDNASCGRQNASWGVSLSSGPRNSNNANQPPTRPFVSTPAAADDDDALLAEDLDQFKRAVMHRLQVMWNE
mmetsp:Transcript_10261/g.14903  ORF Transcript_10261/g.14903 Transcript_10261/m.14903 type:complete len:211 (+) Transcript_10261:2-634(+)